jgi:hypothetical protein
MPFELDDDDGDDRGREERSRRRVVRRASNPIGDFLTFRLMVTPVVIQIVFWLGVLACVGVGIRTIVASFDAGGPARKELSVMMLAGGVMLTFGGPLLVRIYCELLMIFFKIHDELKEANDRTRRY